MTTTGRNISFKIYDHDNLPFHDLVLHKATYDSTVMSLSDKITGDVYYKDTSLVCSMHEYIVYNGVQFTLVNPPTIVREGMVSDNSDLKGMTKYSFEFYHPMYMLNNLPFTDIAVSSDELRYKSQDKIFSWVGYFADYVAKLNKNLEGTQWICEQGAKIPQEQLEKISDVLSFSDNTIGDALKTAYDTWAIPFVIDILSVTDARYAQGKRYLIYFGEPANEIYANATDKENGTPFVFRFGQGVGLKNNSATPRNNKIVTRLAGYGSERNIPFGYPQIVWTGDQDWDYTIDNDSTNPLSYPIYKGIYGGAWVKLIKHPFTRSHLMPTIYAETIAKKVDPNNANYNPNIEIIDYHDALDSSIYPHTINPLAPSYEIHEFEDIFPELGVQHIVSVQPINDDLTDADGWDDTMDDEGNYKQSYFKLTLPQLEFDLYACAAITQEMQINMRTGACIGCTFDIQVDWEEYKINFYDSDGNFAPNGGQRDLTKYPKSNEGQITVVCKKDINTFGTIMPNVYQYPKGASENYEGDTFVILGISLPQSYITSAQTRLDDAIDAYMLENNVYYYDYPLKFDEYFLATHQYILSQIKNNTIVRFEFQGAEIPLSVKQLTIKYGESPLPQYNITLTDSIEVVLNQIAQVAGDVSKMQGQLALLQTSVGKGGGTGTDVTKLSRVTDDTANGVINFVKGLTAGAWLEGSSGAAIHKNNQGNWVVEADYFNVRKKLQANEIEILHSSHIGGRLIATPASMVVSQVEFIANYETTYQRVPWTGNCYKCYFLTEDNGNKIYNTFKAGDLAYCETYNLEHNEAGLTHSDTTIGTNHFYWRKVIETGENYIILSDVLGEYAAESDYPFEGDHITLLGSQAQVEGVTLEPISGGTSYTEWETDTSRQNAIIIAGAGAGNPFIRVYKGIDDFYLPNPDVQISPNGTWITVNDGSGNDVRIDALLESIQQQVEQVQEQDDKQIVLWFGTVTPTLSNEPAVNWETEQIRHEHVSDIYYDRQAGLAYTFVETITNEVASYAWELLEDADVLRSLELAAQAQDTADGKRRVFVARPTQADTYDIGDLWVNATFPTQLSDGESTFGDASGTIHTIDNPLYNNDILRCVIAKESGESFNISHWMPPHEYTTSKIEQTADRISLEVTSDLATTGIDITNGKIELNAANTIVSNTLSVNRLETVPDTNTNANNQAKVEISGSTMNVFGATGIMNIQFGVDENGYAVLKYFDNDGFLLYDLGPNGIRTLDINDEGFYYEDYYVVSEEGENDTSTTQTTLGQYHPKKIGPVVSAGSIAGGDDNIAAQASGKVFDTGALNGVITSIVANGALDTAKLVNGTYRLSDELFSMSDLELYGNSINDAKADLILMTGISQSQADAFNWETETSGGETSLKYTIYWREYTTFVDGVEQQPHTTVWQESYHEEH